MSNTTTEWILELVDRVSKPLKRIDSLAKHSKISLGAVDRLLDRINKRSRKLSGSLRKMTTVAAVFGAMSYGSAQFEHGMARANTMANLGTAEIAAYTSQIRNLSEVIPVAKKQLSEGLYATISAGVPEKNWIDFLNSSSKAAIGGNAELGVVVDATSSIIKAYGDSWNNASKIQDGFQKTVNLGQIPSLESLASAMPRVTAVAADLRVSQDELNSVFATASGVMGKPAEVATQLNAVLSALLKPGAEATKMANNLGIAFNAKSIDKAGGLKNYLDVLMPRIKAYSQVTGITQQEIIGHLFGSQEAIKLVIGLGGKLADSFGENTKKIGNSTGAVQAAFDIMNATTNSKVQLMRNSFGNAMDGIYASLAPLLRVVLGATITVFQFIRGFTESHPVLTKFIVIGTTVTFGIVAMSIAVSLVSLKFKAMYLNMLKASLSSNVFTASMAKAGLATLSFVKSLFRVTAQLAIQGVGYLMTGAAMLGSFLVGLVAATAAQWGLNIALNANPIGLIVIGIAAAVGAITLLIKYWGHIKSVIWKFTKFLYKISPFGALIEMAEKIFPGFKAKIGQVFEYVENLILKFWNKIKEVFGKIKAFFGFGEDVDANVTLKVKKDEHGNIIPESNYSAADLGLLTNTSGGNTSTHQPFTGAASGAGKTINMTLDIKNVFNVSGGNLKDGIDDIADQIIGKINDKMRDAVIALD